jgi:hypothetical protein
MLKPFSNVASPPLMATTATDDTPLDPPTRVNPIVGGRQLRRTPLSLLIGEHLRANGLRQIDFCRQSGFDQGLLSKILSSVVNTLNVETALKLAEAMSLPPVIVFEAIGKKEIDDLLRKFYSKSD